MKKNRTIEQKLKRKKTRFVILGILFLIVFTGIYYGNRWSKKHGFTSFWDFVTTVSANYTSSFNANFETAEITISESDFNKLQKQRDYHLENGMITKVPDRYVPALITHNNEKIKCKIRLKGHMTDHLQNNKWSFRVKTVSGNDFKGMRIFSLMHPGTRNYIYEWIYHRMLEDENIVSVRYSFIKLKVNGSDWGIYAVEENFGKELINYAHRPKGPIIGFNPDLYWYARFNDHKNINVDVENIYIGSSYPEAFQENENFKDDESRSNYAEASILLEKFRRGELKTSEVFDIKKLALFHAIIDLVGGHFSLDWSDVKYYYNPLTQKVEPVGYESFSVQNIKSLSGASKYKNRFSKNLEWHDLIFSDADFFKEYVKSLLRVSKKNYLDKFFSKHINQLNNNIAILYKNYPYKKLTFDQYFINQKNILTLLSAPIIPVIYFNGYQNDSLEFTVGSNAILPIKLNEIIIGDVKIKPSDDFIFTTRNRSESIVFEKYKVKYDSLVSKKDLTKMKWNLVYLGLKAEKQIDVKPINVTPQLNANFILPNSTFENFEFVKINKERNEIVLQSGEHVLKSDLIIPEGYKVFISSPFKLDLINGARIVSSSSIQMLGNEEDRIILHSSDSTGKGLVLLNCIGKSIFKNIDFMDLGLSIDKAESYKGIITLYNSTINLTGCNFNSKSNLAIFSVNSKLNINGSTSFYNNVNGIVAEFSKITFSNIYFNRIKKNGIKLSSTIGRISKIDFSHVKNPVKLENYSIIKGEKWQITDAKDGISAYDLSKIEISNLVMKNVEIGFKAKKKDEIYGPSIISINGLKKEKIKKLKENDSKSKIIIK